MSQRLIVYRPAERPFSRIRRPRGSKPDFTGVEQINARNFHATTVLTFPAEDISLESLGRITRERPDSANTKHIANVERVRMHGHRDAMSALAIGLYRDDVLDDELAYYSEAIQGLLLENRNAGVDYRPHITIAHVPAHRNGLNTALIDWYNRQLPEQITLGPITTKIIK